MQPMEKNIPQKSFDFRFLIIFVVILAAGIGLTTLLYHANKSIWPQFFVLLSIAVLFLVFFFYSLQKIDQSKQWIQQWAMSPLWVFLAYFSFPVLLTVLINLFQIQSIIPGELVHRTGKTLLLPHFLFFYFWQVLVFFTAFWFHPRRKAIIWRISWIQLLTGILVGLASWSLGMFSNEIIFQQILIQVPYQDAIQIFWLIVPFALLIQPLGVGFYYYELCNDQQKRYRIILLAVLFSLLSMRWIVLLPAFCFFLITGWISYKKAPVPTMFLAYSVFNLCVLLLNWQGVI